jgi:hypothetical protein
MSTVGRTTIGIRNGDPVLSVGGILPSASRGGGDDALWPSPERSGAEDVGVVVVVVSGAVVVVVVEVVMTGRSPGTT